MDRFVCAEDGCEKGRASGHALYRVSPKGELFEGKCAEHFGGPLEPITQAIEDHNQRMR